MEKILAPFPRVRSWMARTAEAVAPHHKDVTAFLVKAAGIFAKRLGRDSKL